MHGQQNVKICSIGVSAEMIVYYFEPSYTMMHGQKNKNNYKNTKSTKLNRNIQNTQPYIQ